METLCPESQAQLQSSRPDARVWRAELNWQSSACLVERIYQEAESRLGSLPWGAIFHDSGKQAEQRMCNLVSDLAQCPK